ncbi:hypothetical protein WAH63_21935, partial [Acinetobacter baumannii]
LFLQFWQNSGFSPLKQVSPVFPIKMSKQLKSPFALVIVDGWGISQNCERNAFFLAHTPNFDALEKSFGRSELHAAGESVGLLA